MIKMIRRERGGSLTPCAWRWSESPFPAFRGSSQSYFTFLAAEKGFRPTPPDTWWSRGADEIVRYEDFCKIRRTDKGTLVLTPCEESEDQKIILVTAGSCYRGRWINILPVGASILKMDRCHMGGQENVHIILRIDDPDGCLILRTFTGSYPRTQYWIDVFSWDKEMVSLDENQYNAEVAAGRLPSLPKVQRDGDIPVTF